ncbi:MAG: hypothetical protein M1828_004104 [Chrysothrix sp. TS-e1954]|nr:MAG: hypothetical protein M1828_004104 [Chrysothrix sp. TS-e1954]
MQGSDGSSTSQSTGASQHSPGASRLARARDAFALPPTVKRLFDATPLVSYSENARPRMIPYLRDRHVLHVFCTPAAAVEGAPSYNPGCLKWQTLLLLSGVPFRISPSSNHSSPTGALPYLEPSQDSQRLSSITSIPTPGLLDFIRKHAKNPASLSPSAHCKQYVTLLNTGVRLAYLYCLYLEPDTFDSVAMPYYIQVSSQNQLVQSFSAYNLRDAAAEEIMSGTPASREGLRPALLLAGAREAFAALARNLGEAEWFASANVADSVRRVQSSHGSEAGFLDASVFAYTHVIITLFSGSVGKIASQLYGILLEHKNLLNHRKRLLTLFENG